MSTGTNRLESFFEGHLLLFWLRFVIEKSVGVFGTLRQQQVSVNQSAYILAICCTASDRTRAHPFRNRVTDAQSRFSNLYVLQKAIYITYNRPGCPTEED